MVTTVWQVEQLSGQLQQAQTLTRSHMDLTTETERDLLEARQELVRRYAALAIPPFRSSLIGGGGRVREAQTSVDRGAVGAGGQARIVARLCPRDVASGG